jgi:hypothetical protein
MRPLKKQNTGRNKPISFSQSLLDTNWQSVGRTYPSKNTYKTACTPNLKINTRHRGAGDPGTINYRVLNAIHPLVITITLIIAVVICICFIARIIIIVCMLR